MKPQYDLSILIPARNEMFVAKTVEDILLNKRGNTEIIVALDGQWANPGIPNHPDVTIVYFPQSIGQRAATNQACRLSQAKYVMKCDAHCAFDEGFDIKLIAEMQENYTMIPMMYNLHVFDWVCKGGEGKDPCGHRIYQGPTPTECPQCKGKMEKELIWKPRLNRKSTHYRFDKELHFQYWGDFGNRPEAQGDIVESMSAQGSCFLLTRKKYWELNICDEEHGSWGQQGVEVACKTWLSGGRLVINKKTWYSHMFRTQGGDFGFPYPVSGKQVAHARKYSRDMWLNDKWPLAIHPFSWLIEKFKPIPDWHDVGGEAGRAKTEPLSIIGTQKATLSVGANPTTSPKKLTKGVVYYTHGVGDPLILEKCRRQLAKGMKTKHIVSVSASPLEFGKNILLPHVEETGFFTMFLRILVGLKESSADIIFFCEHDVLYHPSHFDFIPPEKDKYYYNTNIWRVRSNDGHALWVDDLKQLSGLVAYRETLLTHYRERMRKILKNGLSLAMGFEPGTHGREERIDDLKAESYQAKFPNIDIRHETNATASRWKKEDFRNQKYTEGWKEAHFSTLAGWNPTFGTTFTDFLSSI